MTRDPRTNMFINERELAEKNLAEADAHANQLHRDFLAAAESGDHPRALTLADELRGVRARIPTLQAELDAAMSEQERKEKTLREQTARGEVRVRRAHLARVEAGVRDAQKAIGEIGKSHKQITDALSALQGSLPEDGTPHWPVGWWRLNKEIVADVEYATGAAFAGGKSGNLTRATTPLIAVIKSQIDTLAAQLPPASSDVDTNYLQPQE